MSLGADGKPVIEPTTGQPQMTQEGLIQAFTNPTLFANGVARRTGGSVGTAAIRRADIVLGTVNQVGNEIDEFVTGTLQNNLLGLPLDLASLNIARGRDTGVAPLNLARAQLFAAVRREPAQALHQLGGLRQRTEAPRIAGQLHRRLRHACQPHHRRRQPTRQKLAAAQALVDHRHARQRDVQHRRLQLPEQPGRLRPTTRPMPGPLHDSTGAAGDTGAPARSPASTMSTCGSAAWPRSRTCSAALLGSTFEYVFRTQMEALQDGDRLYYLPRIEGTDYEESLQDSSLAQLIRANTDIKHLPGNIFLTPEYTIEASDYYVKNADGNVMLDANGNPTFLTNADGSPNTTNWLHEPGDRQAAGQRRRPTGRCSSSATTTSSATTSCWAAPRATTS